MIRPERILLLFWLKRSVRLFPDMRLGQSLAVFIPFFDLPHLPASRVYTTDDAKAASLMKRSVIRMSSWYRPRSNLNSTQERLFELIEQYSISQPEWSFARTLAIFASWSGNRRPWFYGNVDDETYIDGAVHPRNFEYVPRVLSRSSSKYEYNWNRDGSRIWLTDPVGSK